MSANQYTAFLQKVDAKGFDPNACWAWLGAGKGNGYGNVRVGSDNPSAHKRAYQLFVGPVPPGHDVRHTCDNRWCVNPDHLFLGTRLVNMADMSAKGRGAGGCRKHLKEHTVQEIRRLLNCGLSNSKIAAALNVNYSTVRSIARGESYVGIG